MSNRKARTFTADLAKRGQTPLLVSLLGPSGSGKTYSALRLATGFQSVVGGSIFGIDTESGRMKHYADKFKFHHVPFAPPFAPADYLDAIKTCVAAGAKVIVIDSMSHEHDGEGGVLEMRDAEWARGGKQQKDNFTSWVGPKAERNRLIQYIVQCNCLFVFCFRAKDKIRPAKGSQPEKLGLQPVGGKEFLFEMMVQAILPAGCDGYPQWHPDEPAARLLIKAPSQFRELLLGSKSQISEEMGAAMARWANGGAPPLASTTSPVDIAIAQIECCMDGAELDALRNKTMPIFRKASSQDKSRMSSAMDAARERVAQIAAAFLPPVDSETGDDEYDEDQPDPEKEERT